jgi:hypothetical protein
LRKPGPHADKPITSGRDNISFPVTSLNSLSLSLSWWGFKTSELKNMQQLKLSARLIKSLPISSLPSTPSSTLQQIASSHSKGISLYLYVLYIQVGVCVFAVAVLPFLFFSFCYCCTGLHCSFFSFLRKAAIFELFYGNGTSLNCFLDFFPVNKFFTI